MKCQLCDKEAEKLEPTKESGALACKECNDWLNGPILRSLLKKGEKELNKSRMYKAKGTKL